MTNNTTPERDELRAKLRRLAATHDDVASALSVGRSTVTLWLSGEISSPALDKAIPAFVRGLELGASKAAV